METQIRKLYVNKEHMEVMHLWQSSADEVETCGLVNRDFLNPILLNVLNQSPCVTWILDLRTRKFNFVSKNVNDIFGYQSVNYCEEGLSFHEKIKHPDDRQVIWKFLFQIWKALEETPPPKRAGYKFSFDYRIQHEDGKERRILEQNTVLQQDQSGKITHLLGVCSDITHWKKDNTQIALLASETDKKHYVFTAGNAEINKPNTVLSKRELEVAKLMAEGRSSKYIADKLFISFHTVNTHRKNMIEKTRSKNTGGLVQFVVCNGLI